MKKKLPMTLCQFFLLLQRPPIWFNSSLQADAQKAFIILGRVKKYILYRGSNYLWNFETGNNYVLKLWLLLIIMIRILKKNTMFCNVRKYLCKSKESTFQNIPKKYSIIILGKYNISEKHFFNIAFRNILNNF